MTAPLLFVTPLALERLTEPPVAVELSPASIMIPLPTSLSTVLPTDKIISPPAPVVAAPVLNTIAPEEPELVVPVENDKAPLTPAAPAFDVRNTTLPLDLAVPAPDESET